MDNYTFKRKNPEIEDQSVTNINRLPPRANLIPADRRGIYYKNKEASPMLKSLNGVCRFLYSEAGDVVDGFFGEAFDDSCWDDIDVPSMWQYRGYGKCRYPNIEYAIPFDPPYVPAENPVGYYRRSFELDEGETQNVILHFGGVDNAFYVYLNGRFVGFSKGSRNPAEFDITPLCRSGTNLLAVKVFTYSDATYLENQDMLLANGIFRDVYLLCTGKTFLWDFRVTNDLKGFTVAAQLSRDDPEYELELELDGQKQRFAAKKHVSATFVIDCPKLWNPEEPSLYDLTITLLRSGQPVELHSKRVGMMRSEIAGGKLTVNGMPIFIKGVNRHEYDCDNGRAVSVGLIERELRLIKDNNLNAIRTSHYTNNPAFYELCSELGILVMDEADYETHGCGVTGDQGYLSKRADWLAPYLDRTERMLEQNKNETCIFMRSCGNECGNGQNLRICQQLMRAFDPAHVAINDEEPGSDGALLVQGGPDDMIPRAGYLSREWLEKYTAAQQIFMQIEYAHAMGNSPGFLEDAQAFEYEDNSYIGGFVWEFKNHGFHKIDEHGRDYYLYGGDFGDKNNWYNFCLDGYLMSDGTPKPSWYELGEVFAPVWAWYRDGRIEIMNTLDFRSLSGFVCRWRISADYTPVRCGELVLGDIAPHARAALDIDVSVDSPVPGADYYLDLEFYDGTRRTGGVQLKLRDAVPAPEYVPPSFDAALIEENGGLAVKGDGFSVRFENGVPCEYVSHGKALLDSPMTVGLFRAPTDNDGILGMPGSRRNAGLWLDNVLETAGFRMRGMTAELKKDRAVVRATGKILPISKFYGFDADISYEVFGDGRVLVTMHGVPFGELPERLPRIGVCFHVSAEYENVTWFGRGWRENYCDRKRSTPVGLYTRRIDETYVVYDMPQETGNHENTRFVSVCDASGQGLRVDGCREFAFSYHDFTLESLTAAKHKNELVRSAKNHLYIDYRMRGLGSHSCGPEPEEEYELHPHEFTFSFALTPAKHD